MTVGLKYDAIRRDGTKTHEAISYEDALMISQCDEQCFLWAMDEEGHVDLDEFAIVLHGEDPQSFGWKYDTQDRTPDMKRIHIHRTVNGETITSHVPQTEEALALYRELESELISSDEAINGELHVYCEPVEE